MTRNSLILRRDVHKHDHHAWSHLAFRSIPTLNQRYGLKGIHNPIQIPIITWLQDQGTAGVVIEVMQDISRIDVDEIRGKVLHLSWPLSFIMLFKPPVWNYFFWKLRREVGLATLRDLMLAVFRSLRNSNRLIFPSLSMSVSSRSGSMEPLKPVCCKATEQFQH